MNSASNFADQQHLEELRRRNFTPERIAIAVEGRKKLKEEGKLIAFSSRTIPYDECGGPVMDSSNHDEAADDMHERRNEYRAALMR